MSTMQTKSVPQTLVYLKHLMLLRALVDSVEYFCQDGFKIYVGVSLHDHVGEIHYNTPDVQRTGELFVITFMSFVRKAHKDNETCDKHATAHCRENPIKGEKTHSYQKCLISNFE